jgi:hypothetical protein
MNYIAPVTVSSVTDSAGNTYKLAILSTESTPDWTWSEATYYASNIKAHIKGNIVTVKYSTSFTYSDVNIQEFSGVTTLDKTAGGTGDSDAPATGYVTTTAARELLIAGAVGSGDYPTAQAMGPGFTQLPDDQGNILEYKVVNSIGSYNASGTLTESGDWSIDLATFYTPTNSAVTAGTSLPQNLGTIVPGGSATVTVNFPGTAGGDGASAAEAFAGTYTGGTFLGTIRGVLP